jgi:riboflavin synthase
MFTGIVEELGRTRSLEDRAGGARLVVECATVNRDASAGDSVAVNGVCLTAVDVASDALSFDLAGETLERSTLGRLRTGDSVNLERPLTLAGRLGGHLVQGHVDGVAPVHSVDRNGGGASMRVALPRSLRPYVVERGSVAVDGVSLTVAAVDDEGFEVALIPHTLAVTTLGERGPGDEVNLEADVLAKYVEGLTRRGR